ncbi:ubiquinol-cytochrome c reductase iron-sulfur subunit [Desulfitobacterium sp. Sab5]|uniref:QcrA and Rieske domain-containing protein n=1 Tax=Desulfitobacterium TaxID=36853 RepID=UPI003CE967C4
MDNKEKNQGVNRRHFIGLLGLAPVAAALTIPLGATGKYLEPPASLTAPPQPMLLSGVAELEAGSVKNFNYNNTSAVLMKKSDKDYIAFYRRCTHLGCTVEWEPNEKIFLCPCHGGKFDAEGKNIDGPPPKPLIALKVTVQDNDKIQIEEKEA